MSFLCFAVLLRCNDRPCCQPARRESNMNETSDKSEDVPARENPVFVKKSAYKPVREPLMAITLHGSLIKSPTARDESHVPGCVPTSEEQGVACDSTWLPA